MSFNEDPTSSANLLPLYEGPMTLVPHQGPTLDGIGITELICGPGTRHLRVRYKQTSAHQPSTFPGSRDGKYGPATTFMRVPSSKDFFVFLTSGFGRNELVGEARTMTSHETQVCDYFEVYLLNCLIPITDMTWSFSDWMISSVRTSCAYDLTRVSLPTEELNLTHKLTVSTAARKPFRWSDFASDLNKMHLFLSFANCSPVLAPVVYGYEHGRIQFFRFEAPKRSVPTNRRTWATNASQADLRQALSRFIVKIENDFWQNILTRAIEWQVLTDASTYDSDDQALFTVQMLLEMLAFVLLVEDGAVLGEAGYGKLPASDRITLLCSRTGQSVALRYLWRGGVESQEFCRTNQIGNVGELIAALRNKLIHPTKKNREYLDHVPDGLTSLAVYAGLQIASLTILNVVDYRGMYYDLVDHETHLVP